MLLDGRPPPDDVRLTVLRATAFAALHWHDKAEAEYAKALRARPADTQIQLVRHFNRAHLFACKGEGELNLAAAELDEASALELSDCQLYRFRSVAHLGAGQGAAYRRVCAEMMERFEKTQDPWTACNVVVACVAGPDALADMGRLIPLAQMADRFPYRDTAWLGAAFYRCGQYVEARRCFEDSARLWRPRAWDWCFRAMVHHRLGQTEEAQRCLNEAAQWIKQANIGRDVYLEECSPAWNTILEIIEVNTLFREAQALLQHAR
jgi:tetratricopeptide (TPR) repeat protein